MSSRWRLFCAVVAAGAAAALACNIEDGAPGDVVLGTFDLVATFEESDCPFQASIQGPGRFSATLSYSSDDKRAYLSVGPSTTHSGTFENNRLVLSSKAQRHLPEPCDCPGVVAERVEGQLVPAGLSVSCESLPDGGLSPAPDAGLADAGAGETTYDLFCDGVILDTFTPDAGERCPAAEGCPCEAGCTARYRLSGVRIQ